MVNGIEFLKNDDEVTTVIHMRCSAHILNLSVQAGLECEQISEMIVKIRNVCKKIHSSTKLTAELTVYEKANKEKELSVVLDVEVRWNSTYDMLNRAVKIRKSLLSISKDLKEEKLNNDILVDNDDFEKAIIVLDLLEPFNQSIFLN